MVSINTTEGEIDFPVGLSKPTKTWYKIFGDLSEARSKSTPPLILLHGGPGAGHEYLLPFVDLYTKYSIPCIFYDQLGCGHSTRLRELDGDKSFWTEDLFIRELNNLIDHFNLRDGPGFQILGQSWGGMLGSSFAATRPKGLKKLVIANSPASMQLWVKGIKQLLEKLPPDVAETIRDCERRGEFDSKEYADAILVVYKRHLCRVEPWPAPEAKAALDNLTEDPTVYGTMNGPSEITITGTLRNWSVIERLPNIEVPVFTFHGSEDEAQDVAVAPFFWHIPKVKWVTVQDASHLSHVEKRDQVMRLVGEFLVGK